MYSVFITPTIYYEIIIESMFFYIEINLSKLTGREYLHLPKTTSDFYLVRIWVVYFRISVPPRLNGPWNTETPYTSRYLCAKRHQWAKKAVTDVRVMRIGTSRRLVTADLFYQITKSRSRNRAGESSLKWSLPTI